MNDNKKKYGLTIMKKKTNPLIKKNPKMISGNVFGDDSSDEDTNNKKDKVNRHRNITQKSLKAQTVLDMQKALEQDPTVYQYDDVYDTIKNDNNLGSSSSGKKKKDKKPKYFQHLMKTAEKRKKEQLRVEERKIDRERHKEGNMFSDKEQFVTSAYKKRQEERRLEEEEERREAALEEMMDVRKQKDMTGFYRHFMRQATGEEEKPNPPPLSKNKVPSEDQTSESSGDSDEDGEDSNVNEDADSDFSIDDSDSEEERPESSKEVRKESSSSSDEDSPKKSQDVSSRKRVASAEKEPEKETKSKFAKRTDDAKLALLRQRYEQRKQQKEQK